MRLAFAFVGLLAACGEPPSPLERARDFLVSRQSPDGAWRSQVHASLRDTLALTPPALKVLLLAPRSEASDAAIARAVARLREVPEGPLAYPVYTSSGAVIALALAGEIEARERRLALLLGFQLGEANGWTREDAAFGGFGHSLLAPRKGQVAPDADLSSTLFALGALRFAGVPRDHPAFVQALVFVERCQNLDGDGGFFLSPVDPVRNKAGASTVQGRFRSYGSATADGLRALLACGVQRDDARVLAAADWLRRSFDPAANPGAFLEAREVDRASSYHYWAWSAAHAFQAVDGPTGWREALAGQIRARQLPDGSWMGGYRLLMEDDPLVATPLAAAALAITLGAPARRPILENGTAEAARPSFR